MRRKTETESTIEMSTAQKDYEQAIGLLSGNAEMLAVERRIRAYVKELDEKAAAPKKERAERKKMFAVHLDFVHHELPRSKKSADSCASITAYVDDLNTDYEKVCAEMLDDAAALREWWPHSRQRAASRAGRRLLFPRNERDGAAGGV